MNIDTVQDRSFAYLLLRLVLGLNIAIHGISRLYAGPAVFANALIPMFAHTPLPSWLVYAFGISLPWVEAITGLCVLFGALSRWAYVLGLLEIAALTFGSTLRQDWESAGLQLTYALIYAILLSTREYNTFSMDRWLSRAHRSSSPVPI
jgi:thiosulfate dehydrogenase (quinone) large subunit